jgi:hypothetical protein
VPKNSVESYFAANRLSALAHLAGRITSVPTYSYQLCELANRRVRHELELHNWQCWSDGASGEIGCQCVEAHGEEDCPSARG